METNLHTYITENKRHRTDPLHQTTIIHKRRPPLASQRNYTELWRVSNVLSGLRVPTEGTLPQLASADCNSTLYLLHCVTYA
ncbi:hypothetical protein FRX31_005680 [Thalictrum thalictroides]|uniref:Uncharacterized protein n=1 Tax=Thalictrum thalictroides TaxID=46969 RepID=A0A7J6X5S6_THATH|nr:hypothetical protein FRX31_005680 [Thalictrum thalictroides]